MFCVTGRGIFLQLAGDSDVRPWPEGLVLELQPKPCCMIDSAKVLMHDLLQ